MTDAPVDPLHDVFLELERAGLDVVVVRRVLAAVRRRWNGETYIRAKDPLIDEEIERRLSAGEHPREIAEATGRHRTSIVRRRSSWL